MIGRRWALLAPSLVALILYLPALGNGFVFDDRGAVLENPVVRDHGGLRSLLTSPWWNAPGLQGGLYRPVTTATFAIDHALAGGFAPRWFHAVNVLLHVLVTGLVVRLALLVCDSTAGALAAGLLFAVHPAHVEAVAGIVGRAEILAAALVLGGLLLHRAAQGCTGRTGAVAALAAPAAILLAMLSKESALVAPALAWILDQATPARPGAARRRYMLYSGYVVAALLALGLRALALGGLGVGTPIPLVDNPAATAGAVRGRLTALACLARYAGLLTWPTRLSADYSYDQIPLASGMADPAAILGFVLGALVLVAGFALLRRRKPAGFALLFTAAAMSLTSNLLFFIGTLLAERLLYLPSVGLCLLAGSLVPLPRAAGARRAALGAVLAVAVAGGARTWTRLPDWRDDFALYQSAARISPRSVRIRYNLGNAWLRRHAYGEAERQYRQALAIYPGFDDARANLGMALLQQGRSREALATLTEAAIRLPRNVEVAVNLGSAWRAAGDPVRAEAEFRRALALAPEDAMAWNNLGSLALSRGDVGGALEGMGRAVAADPGFAVYHVNLADALVAAGRKPEAMAEFARAAELDPGLPEARRGLGEVALERGDAASAETEFRAALEGDPPSSRAANFLGYLLARRGDAAGAAAYYQRALELDETLYDAHRSLGLLYATSLADPARAAEHLRRSLALAPDQPGADELRRRLGEIEGPRR